MVRQLVRALCAASLLLGFAVGANALIVTDSTPTAGETGDFSDGANDYFGVVSGGLIAGTTFTPNETSPPEGSIAGRDHDDGNTKPAIRTATWSLAIPGGTPFVQSIIFSGTLAAADGSGDGFVNWNPGRITLDLLVNGAPVDTRDYCPTGGTCAALAMSPSLSLGGVSPTVLNSGIVVSLSDPGGAGITSVELRVTADSSSGEEDWWLQGTLSADAVPEPTTALLLAGGLAALAARRRR